MRLAAGAVKAVSRAQRGRSEAERLDGPGANRTIGERRPANDGQMSPAFATRSCTATRSRNAEPRPHDFHSDPQTVVRSHDRRVRGPVPAQTAWREPPAVAAGETANHEKGLVAHATVLRLSVSPTVPNRCGRRRAPPDDDIGEVAAVLAVQASKEFCFLLWICRKSRASCLGTFRATHRPYARRSASSIATWK